MHHDYLTRLACSHYSFFALRMGKKACLPGSCAESIWQQEVRSEQQNWLRPAPGFGSLREGLLEEDGPKGSAASKLALVSGCYWPVTYLARGEARTGAPSTTPAPGTAGTPPLQAASCCTREPCGRSAASRQADRRLAGRNVDVSSQVEVVRNCRGSFSEMCDSRKIGAKLLVMVTSAPMPVLMASALS